MRTFILALSFFLIFGISSGQDSFKTRNSFISAGYMQINESANFGLVFKGPGLDYGMCWNFNNGNRMITYEYELGLGILFSRDIPALGFYLKPVDLAYMFKIPAGEGNLHIGPSLKLEYNYNLYPDLQSGFDYWFTTAGIGVNALYDFTLKNSAFQIKLNTSLMGLTSRQEDYRDPYFYDIGFKYALRHLHHDLTASSLGRFNTTSFEVLWKSKPDSGLTLGYSLNYSGYYQAPELRMVSHSLKFIINKKQN